MAIKTAWDGTAQDIEAKKAENLGKVLLEVLDHKDEKALVFGDPPPMVDRERIVALELRVSALEKKP